MNPPTDLPIRDRCDDAVGAADGRLGMLPPAFHDVGGRPARAGPLATVNGHEDNARVEVAVGGPGHGRVPVVTPVS